MGKYWERFLHLFPSFSFVKLYTAYTISCIGDRLWTFAITLILEYIGGIRLLCLDQLIEEIIIMVLSSFVGNWLDRQTRKRGTLTVLAVNNVNVALSAALLAASIRMNCRKAVDDSSNGVRHGISITCLVLAILCCSLGCLASEAEKLAFTKDWIVVMTAKEHKTLSVSNAVMKTIDLSSAIISPSLSGILIDQLGYEIACILFVVWNLVSWVVEGLLLRNIYYSVPELATRTPLKDETDDKRKKRSSKTSEQSDEIGNCWSSLFYVFHVYWSQTIFTAAFGLALLYMTVLGFDGIAIGYGRSQGLSATWLGILRSIGSACGIAGVLSYTAFETNIGVRRTGLIGFTTQQLALYVCIASIWLPGSPFDPYNYFSELTLPIWLDQFKDAFRFAPMNRTEVVTINWSRWTSNGHSIISVFTLLMGIAVARFGLYMADLSITQIMQETVPENQRGTVFGVQDSACQFFSVLKDVMVIILPDPRTFGALIIVSVLFVLSGFLFYCYYLIKTRHQSVTQITKETSSVTPELSPVMLSSDSSDTADSHTGDMTDTSQSSFPLLSGGGTVTRTS
uniref:Solute carrier family 40 member n=1 Tax=Ascaris suum TaxID=6253 RepID=F1KUE2_ASCSU